VMTVRPVRIGRTNDARTARDSPRWGCRYEDGGWHYWLCVLAPPGRRVFGQIRRGTRGPWSAAGIARVRFVALRVVFADDNYLVREGVTSLLAEVEGIDVVAAAADLDSLLRAVAENSPDVVLTDIRMPPTNTNEGIEAAKRIRSEHSGVGVVVLSQYVEEDYVFELLAEGAAGMGYLLKERVTDLDELVRALLEVARGGSVLDPLVVEALLARRGGDGPLLGLTDREREVLQEMATGRNNATIAKSLFMSDRAVEKHIGSVFQKLGLIDEHEVSRRVMAVLVYLEATGSSR
jgi:DNA-binding NarL/FixJ family response regulator